MFGKAKLKDIRADIAEALKAVEDKYNMNLEVGRITYDSTSFRASLKANVGNAEDGAKAEFEKYALRFGMEPSDFGKSFIMADDTFEITAIKPRARKYPVVAINKTNGKSYKFAASQVKAFMIKGA